MELAHRLISTRSGTGLLAGLAALLAGVAVLVYVNNYRAGVEAGAAPVTVLVAKQAIAKGTAGEAVLAHGLYTSQQLRGDEVAAGALVNPAVLRGRVALQDVYRGEQLTATSFGVAVSSLSAKLTGEERAVSIPLDGSHGLIGQIEVGDHVDVLAGFNVQSMLTGVGRPVVKVVLQNVPVLAIGKRPAGASGSSTTNVVLRVNDRQSAALAYVADNGKLWLVLRPRAGAPRVDAATVSIETLLGLRPIPVRGR